MDEHGSDAEMVRVIIRRALWQCLINLIVGAVLESRSRVCQSPRSIRKPGPREAQAPILVPRFQDYATKTAREIDRDLLLGLVNTQMFKDEFTWVVRQSEITHGAQTTPTRANRRQDQRTRQETSFVHRRSLPQIPL